MKKLILLLIITFGISSCSDDDTNSTIITPLEGDWLLVYQKAGDPSIEDPPPGDIINENIKYHFTGNIQKITKNGEPFENDQTFILAPEANGYWFTYDDGSLPLYLEFGSNNTIASFTNSSIDFRMDLKKIE